MLPLSRACVAWAWQVHVHFLRLVPNDSGEIAVRVARTCRRLGIPTVAVYVANDAGSLHVRECDEAVCVGTDGGAYTAPHALLEAGAATQADAIHPGYGFLSENAAFARAVQESGMTWLGPPAAAIQDMGCKLRSKELARDAGVAVIPGGESAGALGSVDEALRMMNAADSALRYPVLIQAAAGGGGKGMRICWNDDDLREGYPQAQSEGEKFFADGRLLMRQYLEDPHHIEFQVVCGRNSDDAVDVAIFAERECSVQRRNQKIVEESPSCLLTETTRRRMMEQTARLCQKVGYEGAGTVEWLVLAGADRDRDRDAVQDFYFLEMNTRLQVEHPVTEAVTGGVDLVEAMLEVGATRRLPRAWYDAAAAMPLGRGQMLVMPHRGHAIEGRIYAEDPRREYLPSTGPLLPYKEPAEAVAVDDGSDHPIAAADGFTSYLRLDSGVVEGHVGASLVC